MSALLITAPPAVGAERAPIDAVFVLDRSGSMDGAPIHAVREATCNLLRLLGPDDRLGVVVFDDEAQMVLPLAAHDPDAASLRVRAVETGGSTNLSGGWLKGLEMLSGDVRPHALRRIIVLTDGHANMGVTDSPSLCGLMSAARIVAFLRQGQIRVTGCSGSASARPVLFRSMGTVGDASLQCELLEHYHCPSRSGLARSMLSCIEASHLRPGAVRQAA